MRAFENHPLIPEQSEDHKDLAATLEAWKNLLPNEPRLKERIQRLESGPGLISMLERVSFNDSGTVTMRSEPQDPDFDASQPPLPLNDDDLRGLNEWAGIIFEKAERGTGDQK